MILMAENVLFRLVFGSITVICFNVYGPFGGFLVKLVLTEKFRTFWYFYNQLNVSALVDERFTQQKVITVNFSTVFGGFGGV